MIVGRGRGFAVASFAEPQAHERRRYIAERSRASGMIAPAATGATTLDLSNPRYNNSTSGPPTSLPSQSGTTPATDGTTPKSLPISRNRATSSFTKQTIK